MQRRSAMFALAGVLSASGCGGGVTSSVGAPSAAGTIADLRGGWLIAGTMPNVRPGMSQTFGLAMSLDIENGQVVGSASVLWPCPTVNGAGGAVGGVTAVEPATVAADGSFVLEDKLVGNLTAHQFVVNGRVPTQAGGVWSGSYSSYAANSSCNGTPPPAVPGSYTAVRFADVDGTFSATGQFGALTVPATLTLNLTQGGSPALNLPNSEINDENAIAGTVLFTGSPCFKSGTIQKNQGALLGNHVQLQFTMDDGSMLLVNATVNDLVTSDLEGLSVLVRGGGCDGMFGFSGGKLIKQ